MTASTELSADRSRRVTLAEPRVACPRCGAHVTVALRAGDRMLMACPVCELRWIEDPSAIKTGTPLKSP